ncbi:MAG: iron-containing alcohol dehydrogenase, partial [Chloroflexi bacterium]|nr:iron-containing alcohol dehydrogenase [Chloroflexota bacterium]
QAAAQVVDEFIMGLGMPHRLRDLEIPKEDFDQIAELTLRDGAGRNNPVPITTKEQIIEVLEKAW